MVALYLGAADWVYLSTVDPDVNVVRLQPGKLLINDFTAPCSAGIRYNPTGTIKGTPLVHKDDLLSWKAF